MADDAQVMDGTPEVSAEGVPNEVKAGTVDASTENSVKPHDNHAWVGSLKKKAFDKGYKEAQEEIARLFENSSSQVNNAQSSASMDSQNQGTQNSPSSSDQPGDQVSQNNDQNRMYQVAQAAQRDVKYKQIDDIGRAKYSDYDAKVNEFFEKATEEVKSGNNDRAIAMKMAADIGDQDLVYKLASDDAFFNKVVSQNPRMWTKTLSSIYHSQQPSPEKSGTYHNKIGRPPIESMPVSSSYGEMTQLTSAQKRALAKQGKL